MLVCRTYLPCILTIAFCSPAITYAAGMYTVSGRIDRQVGSSFSALDEYGFTSIGPPIEGGAFHNGDNDFPPTLGVGSSRSSIFGLGADAYARAISVSSFGSNFDYVFATLTFASGIWSDFVVTGPAGPSTVPISVNAFLEGSNTTRLSSSPSQFAQADSSVSMQILGGGQIFGGDFTQTNKQSTGVTQSASGLLANFDGSSVVTTPVFNVPVNTPFSIEFRLSVDALVQSRFGEIFFMESSSNFSNTLTFATNGPVFNLPSGYTINSVDAGIVNNAYVAIPEPSTLWLSALGVGVILVCAIGRRHSHGILCAQASE
jgi:hypothetical protein